MNSRPLHIFILTVLLLAATIQPSFAWYRHGGVWIVGPPVWVDPFPPIPIPVPYPYPYPYPYYPPQPPVVVQQQPDVYIQQTPAPQQTYWYYCPSPKGYYPYIKECPTGWMKVVPTEPNDTQNQPQDKTVQPQK